MNAPVSNAGISNASWSHSAAYFSGMQNSLANFRHPEMLSDQMSSSRSRSRASSKTREILTAKARSETHFDDEFVRDFTPKKVHRLGKNNLNVLVNN